MRNDPHRCSVLSRLFHHTLAPTSAVTYCEFFLTQLGCLTRLHHVNVDRLLFLYQASSNDYAGGSIYSPFPSSVICGENIGQCGYSYGGSSSSQLAENGSPSTFLDFGVGAPRRLLEDDTGSSGGDPRSPQARAYLQRYWQELTDGYKGYSWRLVVDQFNPNALNNRTFGLHVLLDSNNGSQPLMVNNSTVDLSAMRLLPNYCGSYAGFDTFMPSMGDRVSMLGGRQYYSNMNSRIALYNAVSAAYLVLRCTSCRGTAACHSVYLGALA